MPAYLEWTDKAGILTIVRFDVVTKEGIDSSLSITTHPVEDGSDITDHAHAGPDHITLEGYVSNKPLPSNPGVSHTNTGNNISKQALLTQQSRKLEMEKHALIEQFGETPPSLLDKIGGVAAMVSPGGLTKLVVGGIDSLLHKQPDSATVWMTTDPWIDRASFVYQTLREAQRAKQLITVGVHLLPAALDNMLIAKLSAPRTTKDGSGATFNVDLQRVRIVRSATVDAPKPMEPRAVPQKEDGPKAKEEDPKSQRKVSDAKQIHNAANKYLGRH